MSKAVQPKMSAEDRKWEVDDALRTLQRAEQIKNDRQLMPMVKKAAADLNKVVNKPTSKPRSKK